jgi:hypothetical protein
MTRRLFAVIVLTAALAGCSLHATMIPVEGPMSLTRPAPVINVKADGVMFGGSGKLTFTLPPADACVGRWASAAGSGVGYTSGSLMSEYGAIYLSALTVSPGGSQNPGQGLATCATGRTVQLEFVTGAGTRHGFGIAKDSDGNIFKFLF